MPVRGIAVLWVTPDDFPRFKAICGDDIDPTYEEWRARCERKLKPLTVQGIDVERLLIKPDEFLAWCQANGRKPDGEARALYPATVLMERDQS